MDNATLTKNMKQVHGIIHMAAYKVLKNRASAEEVVQETFMTYIEKHHTMRDPGAFSAWMTITAKRKAINRSIQTRETPYELYPSAAVTTETAEDVVAAKERAVLLKEYMSQMGEMDREILQLHYFEGKKLTEIHSELQLPLGTVKRRLFVARKRLRDTFIKDKVEDKMYD